MDYVIWPAIVAIVVGVLAWLVEQAPIIAAPFKRIAQFILVAGLVLWLLSYFGVFDLSKHMRS
jgi:cation transporter-like permease